MPTGITHPEKKYKYGSLCCGCNQTSARKLLRLAARSLRTRFSGMKQFGGATLSETYKYYTTATFIASVVALAGTFLLSFIIEAQRDILWKTLK